MHAAGVADGGMRYVAVACDFVGGIDDDDALFGDVGEDAADFPEHGGLTDAGPSEEEDVLAGEGQVFDGLDGTEYGPSHAAG